MAARRSARALNGQNIVTHQPWTPRAASCLRPAARGRGGCARPTHLAACQCAGARRAGTHAASQSAPPRRQQRRRESRAEADPRATARRGRQGRWNRSGAAAPPTRPTRAAGAPPRTVVRLQRTARCASRRSASRALCTAARCSTRPSSTQTTRGQSPARTGARRARSGASAAPRRRTPQGGGTRGACWARGTGAPRQRPLDQPRSPAPRPVCAAAPRAMPRHLVDDKRLWDVARREPAVAKVASPLIHLARCPLSVRPRPLPRLPPAPFRRLAHLEARSRPSF